MRREGDVEERRGRCRGEGDVEEREREEDGQGNLKERYGSCLVCFSLPISWAMEREADMYLKTIRIGRSWNPYTGVRIDWDTGGEVMRQEMRRGNAK
jgi:hypothetical protein